MSVLYLAEGIVRHFILNLVSKGRPSRKDHLAKGTIQNSVAAAYNMRLEMCTDDQFSRKG